MSSAARSDRDRQVWHGLKNIVDLKQAMIYLVAFFLLNDGMCPTHSDPDIRLLSVITLCLSARSSRECTRYHPKRNRPVQYSPQHSIQPPRLRDRRNGHRRCPLCSTPIPTFGQDNVGVWCGHGDLPYDLGLFRKLYRCSWVP